ncbi:MAG: transcription antitermination factor NusB [Pseudomonadota bacterium]
MIRSRAARALAAVTRDKRTIDWVLEHRPDWMAHPLTQEYVYGVLRHYFELQTAVDSYVHKPLRTKDLDVYCLLLVGAYQLMHHSIPSHAVLNETVAAASKLRKPWSKKLINAVLRQLDSTEQSFGAPSPLSPVLEMLLRQQNSTKDCLQELGAACMQRAPMWIRIAQGQVPIKEYLEQLNQAGIEYTQPFPEVLPETIQLHKAVATRQLPGWERGWVCVQDVGAQLAALLIESGDITKILDACAAPGGKLFHLLDRKTHQNRGRSTGSVSQADALEISSSRANHLQTESARLGHTINVLAVDATTDSWWDGRTYDLILIDAPCSGTGTTRRHPDLQLLLRPEHVTDHTRQQLALLNNLWRMLSPGGTLLYSTCSLLEAENDNVVECFVTQNEGVETEPAQLPLGHKTRLGWQTTPLDNSDGFYYARLKKRVASTSIAVQNRSEGLSLT